MHNASQTAPEAASRHRRYRGTNRIILIETRPAR